MTLSGDRSAVCAGMLRKSSIGSALTVAASIGGECSFSCCAPASGGFVLCLLRSPGAIGAEGFQCKDHSAGCV